MRTYTAVICPACEHFRPDLFPFASDLYPESDYLCKECCEEAIVDYQCQSGCPKCGSDMVLPKTKLVKTKMGSYTKELSTCRDCETDYFAPYQKAVDVYQQKIIKKRNAIASR